MRLDVRKVKFGLKVLYECLLSCFEQVGRYVVLQYEWNVVVVIVESPPAE